MCWFLIKLRVLWLRIDRFVLNSVVAFVEGCWLLLKLVAGILTTLYNRLEVWLLLFEDFLLKLWVFFETSSFSPFV